jgi:hypothetical protein
MCALTAARTRSPIDVPIRRYAGFRRQVAISADFPLAHSRETCQQLIGHTNPESFGREAVTASERHRRLLRERSSPMGAAQRKFDEDFSEGAVQLVREAGKRIAQVARDLGVNEGTLRNWVNADLSQLGALPCSHILRPLPRRLA